MSWLKEGRCRRGKGTRKVKGEKFYLISGREAALMGREGAEGRRKKEKARGGSPQRKVKAALMLRWSEGKVESGILAWGTPTVSRTMVGARAAGEKRR